MPIKETTDTSGLNIGRTVTVSVHRDAGKGISEDTTATGRVVAHGRVRHIGGAVKSWVVFGNDTADRPTVQWYEDRYHTVTIEDAN